MRLYICGNGFDLHHGLRTSYKNYKEFLSSMYPEIIRDYEELVGVLDNGKIAWSDIENALNIDYLKMLCRFADLPSTIDEVYRRTHETGIHYDYNDLESAFLGLTNFITFFTGKYLYDWLTSIKIENVIPDLNLSPYDLYVNFNYLDTLQTLYQIPDSNVFHIHGSLKRLNDLEKATAEGKKDFLKEVIPEVGKQEAIEYWNIIEKPSFQNMYIRQELQFGAVINKNRELEKISKWYHSDEEYSRYIAPSIRVIEDFMDRSTKNPRDNFRKLSRFAWTNCDIDTIVVMGHSLCSVDYPYYKVILVPFFNDKLWIFKSHNGNTDAIMKFIEKTHLKNYRIETW